MLIFYNSQAKILALKIGKFFNKLKTYTMPTELKITKFFDGEFKINFNLNNILINKHLNSLMPVLLVFKKAQLTPSEMWINLMISLQQINKIVKDCKITLVMPYCPWTREEDSLKLFINMLHGMGVHTLLSLDVHQIAFFAHLPIRLVNVFNGVLLHKILTYNNLNKIIFIDRGGQRRWQQNMLLYKKIAPQLKEDEIYQFLNKIKVDYLDKLNLQKIEENLILDENFLLVDDMISSGHSLNMIYNYLKKIPPTMVTHNLINHTQTNLWFANSLFCKGMDCAPIFCKYLQLIIKKNY